MAEILALIRRCLNSICLIVLNSSQSIEETKIWVPDFGLLNAIEGFQTFPETKASIYADGTVQWELSGGLTAFCAFRDLARIPFDTLGCQYIFGKYEREHSSSLNYFLKDPDYLFFGGFEATYNEWNVIPELGEQGELFDGQIIYYNIYFNRSTNHYIRNIVVPTMLLTILSFFTFFLDLRVGERLGFGMALALVVVAQQIVTADMMPVSDQRLWLDYFVSCSFYWVLVGVIESVLIGYIYYIRQDKADRDEAKRQQQNATAEELEPLSMETIEETKPTGTASEPTSTKDSCIVTVWTSVVYEMPIRTFDMFSFTVCLLTYAAFIVITFSMAVTDTWPKNDPMWLDESIDLAAFGGSYLNGDPEN